MKRSAAIGEIESVIYDTRLLSMNSQAKAILSKLECIGILPPPIVGVYDTVPTVTLTGNLDYSYKRAWEAE